MEEEVRGTVDQNEEVRTAAEPVDVPTAEELAESVDVPIEENAEEIPNENVEAAVKEGEIQGEITPVREEVWQHEPNSPYSPLYVPDKNQKKNNKITIILIVLLILSLIGGMIFAVSKLVEAAMGEISAEAPAWQETINNWKSELEESKKDEEQDSIWDDEEKEDDYWEEYEDDYVDEDGYVPNEDDKYYVTLADSIRDDLSYSVEKHEYTFFDDDDNVDIYVEYVTVEGGSLASEDKINEALEEGAMYYAKEFGSEDATDIMIYVESYVTYMDEDTLSVVVSEEEIPYETTKNKTSAKTLGYSEVVTEGIPGTRINTDAVLFVNGVEIERTNISSEITKEPVNEVILVGTAKNSNAAKLNSTVYASGFVFPIDKSATWEVSAYFGDGRGHKAVDLRAPHGTEIYSVAAGKVTYSGYNGDYGYLVVVDHGNGISTAYAHASQLYVKQGDAVSAGETIALVGSTGSSTGNHLHFEVRKGDTRLDPAPYIGLN